VVFFVLEKVGRFGLIKVQGDFVVGYDIPMLAERFQVGALFR
jgi:hypothetical protein